MIQRLLALTVFVIFFSGCATAYKINRVSIGMSEEEVISALGEPDYKTATQTEENLIYNYYNSGTDALVGRQAEYRVILKNSHVSSYGSTNDLFSNDNVKYSGGDTSFQNALNYAASLQSDTTDFSDDFFEDSDENICNSSSYVVQQAIADEFFVINDNRYRARTYCFNLDVGDQVLFTDGSPYGACSSASVVILKNRDRCDLWCE